MEKKLREAMKILDNETTRIQILSNFADDQYCGNALRILLNFVQSYLDLKGWPPEERDLTLKPIPPDREERVKLLDERSKAMIWNEALHLCKLACLKERMKERKIGKKEIVRVIDSALGYEGIGARMTSEEIDKVTTAILKLLNKE